MHVWNKVIQVFCVTLIAKKNVKNFLENISKHIYGKVIAMKLFCNN